MSILNLKWSRSKARDTYGYNRLTGTTNSGKYVTCGGGYDMVGAVIGDWLTSEYQDELRTYAATLTREPLGVTKHFKFAECYGLFARADGSVYLDGARGQESMRRIAESAGLEMHYSYSKRGHLVSVGAYL